MKVSVSKLVSTHVLDQNLSSISLDEIGIFCLEIEFTSSLMSCLGHTVNDKNTTIVETPLSLNYINLWNNKHDKFSALTLHF